MKKLLLISMLLLLVGCTEKEEVWESPYCFKVTTGGEFCTETKEIFDDIFVVEKEFLSNGQVVVEPIETKVPLDEYIESSTFSYYIAIPEIKYIERDYDIVFEGTAVLQKETFDVETQTSEFSTEFGDVEIRKHTPSTLSSSDRYIGIKKVDQYCMVLESDYNNYTVDVDGFKYNLKGFFQLSPTFDLAALELEGVECFNSVDPNYEGYVITYKTDEVIYLYKNESLENDSEFISYYQVDQGLHCVQSVEDFLKEYVVIDDIMYGIQEALDLGLIEIDDLYESNIPNCHIVFMTHNEEIINYEFVKEPKAESHDYIEGIGEYTVYFTNYVHTVDQRFEFVRLEFDGHYYMLDKPALNYAFVIDVNGEYYSLQEGLDEGFFTVEELLDFDVLARLEYGFYSEQD